MYKLFATQLDNDGNPIDTPFDTKLKDECVNFAKVLAHQFATGADITLSGEWTEREGSWSIDGYHDENQNEKIRLTLLT